MKSLMRREDTWNPFREMEDLQNRLNSLMGVNRSRNRDQDETELLSAMEWAPLVDIVEEDKEYLVKAELPEVRKEDLNVTVEKGMLTIAGERKFEKEEQKRKYHRMERSYGSFIRSFALPEDADGSKVEAEFKEGILRVHIPKSETTRPKAIDVKVS
ncbi:MAG: Heat shock protein Hsp20 family [Verrucomicrobiales bacterium]|nr:Heat shock protein Hsp20 family [Verrucomicrobiales bacterium]